MKNHSILSRETVLKSRAFNVQRVSLRLPNDETGIYDLVDHADAVTLLPINTQGEILFVSQYRVGADASLLELPAGVLDGAEEPLLAARRELREETGMDCQQLTHVGGFYMSPGYSNEYMHVFLAEGLFSSPLQMDTDEFLSLSSLPVAQAYRMAWSASFQDGKTLSTLLMALPALLPRYPQILDGISGLVGG